MQPSSPTAEAPDGFPGRAPVKNTFIHYDDCDDEQPDYGRSSKSSPARHLQVLAARGALDAEAEEPAFVEMSSVRTNGRSDDEDVGSGDLGRRPPRTLELEKLEKPRSNPAFVPLATTIEETPSGSTYARAEALLEESFVQITKNTFLHYDDPEDGPQPDYFLHKSGPARLASRPKATSQELLDQVIPSQGPAKLVGMVGTAGAQSSLGVSFSPSTATSSPAAFAAQVEASTRIGPAASIGSAGHASGDCKACAHIWKPGGCSKGYDCTFCHLCTEDDFRRRRKDKLMRLRADKAQNRGAAADRADKAPEHQEPVFIETSRYTGGRGGKGGQGGKGGYSGR